MVPVHFHIGRYLEANISTEFGGTNHLAEAPFQMDPQNQSFEWLKLECQCFLLSVDI